MSARAMWKAVVRFEDVAVPVKLYSGVQDRTIRFHLLHDRDRVRLQQRLVHPDTGDEVPRDEMLRGVEVERGVYVTLDDEELASLEPEPSRTIEITRFVDPAEIDHRWYDRPYWLGPDDSDGAYFGLVRSLQERGLEGVARWTMRKNRYVGALRVQDDHLLLMRLRDRHELVDVSSLGAPEGRDFEAQELKMAEQLIEMLGGTFEPSEWRDTYRARLADLIEAKHEGTAPMLRKLTPRNEASSDLVDALSASLAGLRAERAERAELSRQEARSA